MPGPRIHTEAWERLKVAAKETEAREAEEPEREPCAPAKSQRKRGPRPLLVAAAVLAALSIITASLWIDSQSRLLTAARDVDDFRTRLELLQTKMKNVEEENLRVSDENRMLALQYEQKADDLARLQEEIEALKTHKTGSRVKGQGAGMKAEEKTPGAGMQALEAGRTQEK